jgi:hypothetical protein
MFKEFFMKKMLERQLKDMPKDQQEMIMNLVQKHPDLFQKIGKEIQHKIKNDKKEQMVATMEVMKKYQKELRDAMQSM